MSTLASEAKASQDAENAQDPEKVASTWLNRIIEAERAAEKWIRRGRKITRIYRAKSSSVGDEASSSDGSAKFNIFWSNVETLGPATYSRRPKVEVYRRFHDQDPVGRLAGMILERALQYEIDCRQDFHQTLKAVVKDRLLPGLGQCWVRYEPSFKKEEVPLPDPQNPQGEPIPQQIETLADEFTPVDYVYWEDFLVSPARTWMDARWVARKLLFLPDALKARFGESMKKLGGDIASVPCNVDPATTDNDQVPTGYDADKTDSGEKRARVFEIWDKEAKQLIWVARGCQVPLDIQSDKAHLEEFFPCPRPLLASTTNDEFLPVPDYIYYQDQIRELDSVTRRIGLLVGSLRLIGIYDSTQTALSTLLSGGMENKMVPVNSWAALAEKGGLKGVMDWVPLDHVFKILQGLYEARDQLKQTVYEITGMADIVRGASAASETLGAQQIKAKFANLRLSSRQAQVAEFVTSVLRLKAEIMCDQYSPETLLRIGSVEQISEVQDELEQMAQQAQQQPPQPGMPPPQPPTAAQLPRVQAALELLKSEKARSYRIEVASDSMVELDEGEQEQRREKFMSSVSNFFNSMKNIGQMAPEMMPVALEMLKFVVRGYAVGRPLEASIEDASNKIKTRLANPQPPQPEPAVEVAQIRDQGETQRTQMEIDAEAALAGQKLATEQQTQMATLQHSAADSHLQRQHEGQESDKEAAIEGAEQQTLQQLAQGQQQLMQAFSQLAALVQSLAQGQPQPQGPTQ